MLRRLNSTRDTLVRPIPRGIRASQDRSPTRTHRGLSNEWKPFPAGRSAEETASNPCSGAGRFRGRGGAWNPFRSGFVSNPRVACVSAGRGWSRRDGLLSRGTLVDGVWRRCHSFTGTRLGIASIKVLRQRRVLARLGPRTDHDSLLRTCPVRPWLTTHREGGTTDSGNG